VANTLFSQPHDTKTGSSKLCFIGRTNQMLRAEV